MVRWSHVHMVRCLFVGYLLDCTGGYVLEQPHHWLASQKDYNIKQGLWWWIYYLTLGLAARRSMTRSSQLADAVSLAVTAFSQYRLAEDEVVMGPPLADAAVRS